MLTKWKIFELKFKNWWKDQDIYWVYIHTWYLIKSRNMRDFKMDWALTQKFFLNTSLSFYMAKFFSHKFFNFLIKNIDFKVKIFNHPYSVYYKLIRLYYFYDQFSEISLVFIEQFNRWIILEQSILIEFPYMYDKVDRKKRWSKIWRHWAKKYIITLKYYSGKITSFKGSD